MIPRPCDFCQETYQAEPRYLNRGQGLYCSRDCSIKGNALKRVKTSEPNVTCYYCGTPFYKKQSQINKSNSGIFFCSTAHQTLAASDPESDYRTGPVKSGKEGEKYYSPERPKCETETCVTATRGNRYCARCVKKIKIDTWLSGDLTVTWISTTREPRAFVKQYLIDTRGDQCEVCGFDEKHPVDGRSIITMDHIDGDYTNNHLDNLKLLCPNHHALTSTFGSRNKGGGRRHRLRNYLQNEITR